ncbi:hypothetical protein [Pseudoruegeria sp. HB172150]|uniref:hypothetical protein n=1 Tax=Pseudoruegeria sp. HB172150 TaxID=2721164 RepID=UPI0015550826|nr:hypothetical protein [Pseudoruegeria sp. HB172150]
MAGGSIPSLLLPLKTTLDEIIGNADDDAARQSFDNHAAQLAATGAIKDTLDAYGVTIDDALAAFEETVANSTAYGVILKATWSDLLALSGTLDGQQAEVDAGDTGTHSAATASGYNGDSVSNAGQYSWNASWSRWERIGSSVRSQVADALANIFYALSEPTAPGILWAEVDAVGKLLNALFSDGTWQHRHRAGSIKSTELLDGAGVPQAGVMSTASLVAAWLDAQGKRLLGVSQQGKVFGPAVTPLADEAFARRRSAPDYARGELLRFKTVTVSTAETGENEYASGYDGDADAVEGCFQRMPDLPVAHFSFTNPLAETVEFRRALLDFDGNNYQGEWDPSGGDVDVPGEAYRIKVGWWWQVSVADGDFAEGDRVVFVGASCSSTAFDTADQCFIFPDGTVVGNDRGTVVFRVVPAAGSRFYRGEWDPASAAYPADDNLAEGDSYIVSAAGTYDSVTYAYGDYLVKTEDGWEQQAQRPIIEVAAAGTSEFTCRSGSLREWELRKQTNSNIADYLDLDADWMEPLTARVHEVDGKRNIWLHRADGSVDKLSAVNEGNSYAPYFEGPVLHFKSDRDGADRSYQVATERVPGKFGIPGIVHPERSDKLMVMGDSYGLRWGPPFIDQVEYDDLINNRVVNREGIVVAHGSLDEHYQASMATMHGEGANSGYLSGILCYVLDWANGRAEERAAILRVLGAIQSRTPRLLVVGNTTSRNVSWTGSAMELTVASQFLNDADRVAEEIALEEMLGGDFFEGGTYANMRKWYNSTRSPRFDPTDWDPVLQMSIGDLSETYGTWGLWTIVGYDADNYADLRANINEANFQGYVDDAADRVSTTDWHYYVGTGDGDLTEATTYYYKDGVYNSIANGDGVHMPYADGVVVTGPDDDTADMNNLMAYDVVTELSARGWLDL